MFDSWFAIDIDSEFPTYIPTEWDHMESHAHVFDRLSDLMYFGYIHNEYIKEV